MTSFRSFVPAAIACATIVALSAAVPDARAAKATSCGKVGAPGQVAIVYDGQSVAPPQVEAPLADGYAGKCPL